MKDKNEEKKQNHLEQKLIEAARRAKRKCYFSGCGNYAIKSHLLQKNGVLNQISKNGKFVEYSRATPFRPDGFHITGINNSDMFTFNGFCSEHDASVFDEIENSPTDFSKYRHQLLLSYRGLSNDLFKAEVGTDYFNRIFECQGFSKERKQYFMPIRARRLLQMKETQYLKKIVENELFQKNSKSNFKFYRFEVSKIETATCTIFGGASIRTLNFEAISQFDPYSDNYQPVSSPRFISLIPHTRSLIVIIGYPVNNTPTDIILADKMDLIKENQILLLISDILLKIETWGMSIALYEKLKSWNKINQYLFIRNKWLRNGSTIPSNFNLFGLQSSEISGKRSEKY